MLWAFLKGLLLGGSLIIAIGAQNAFVLQHALRQHHHIAVALLCSIIDAALIALGVWGLGAFIQSQPALLNAITLAGAAFLFCYGVFAFKRARNPRPLGDSDVQNLKSLPAILSATAAISLCAFVTESGEKLFFVVSLVFSLNQPVCIYPVLLKKHRMRD